MIENEGKQKIITIVGSTASGKSALAVSLARRFNGEVISADSRQVYKGLDIGTGKITEKEMKGVPHHMLDVASPTRQYSVARYVRAATKAIDGIIARGKIPIVCGGTGMYVDSLLGKINIPDVPPNTTLRKKLEKKSASELFEILQKLDSNRAKTIDRHNSRRLVRAIEIATALGRVPSLPTTPQKKVDFNIIWLGLMLPPETLRKKISIRLYSRISRGMIEEAKMLRKNGLSWKRMDALGLEYRYLSRYLRGLITEKEMTAKLETEIWHYSKRQLTWFKRNKEITWFNPSSKNWQKNVERHILKFSRI